MNRDWYSSGIRLLDHIADVRVKKTSGIDIIEVAETLYKEEVPQPKQPCIDIVKVAEELYRPREKTAMQRFIDRQTRRILPPLIKAASGVLTPSVPYFNRDDRSWGQAGLETAGVLGATALAEIISPHAILSASKFNPVDHTGKIPEKTLQMYNSSKSLLQEYLASHNMKANIIDYATPKKVPLRDFLLAASKRQAYTFPFDIAIARNNPSLPKINLPGKTIVSGLANPEIMLHEGGHLRNVQQLSNFVGAKNAKKLYTVGRSARYGSAAAAMLASGLLPKDWWLSQNAWAIPAIGALPTLADEGLASARALKFLSQKKVLPRMGTPARNLGLAFGTYMATPAIYGASSYLLNRIRPNANRQAAQ